MAGTPLSLDEDDDADVGLAAIGVLVVGSIAFASWCCCRRCCCGVCGYCCWCSPCCRRREKKEDEPDDTVLVDGNPEKLEHLRRKKELTTAYVLWGAGGFVGAHHFYLDRIVHGQLAAWTLNFFTLGWCLDLVLMPCYVRWFNGQTAEVALSDFSRGRMICRLPLVYLLAMGLLVGVYLQVPRTLHKAGVVDMDAMMAKTERNPYDILGIPHDCSRQEAKTAALERINGKISEAEKDEIKRAHTYISRHPRHSKEAPDDPLPKKRRGAAADPPRKGRARSGQRKGHGVDNYIEEWTDFRTKEWKLLINAFQAWLRGFAERRYQPDARPSEPQGGAGRQGATHGRSAAEEDL